MSDAKPETDPGPVNREALATYVRRIGDLHDERKELNGQITDVYREAKGAGFDVTTLREIVRERQQEPEARHSRYALLNSYRAALGLLADTPLGQAAMERAETEPPWVSRPRPFAEQPVHPPRRRGRPRKNGGSVDDALSRARAHLDA